MYTYRIILSQIKTLSTLNNNLGTNMFITIPILITRGYRTILVHITRISEQQQNAVGRD